MCMSRWAAPVVDVAPPGAVARPDPRQGVDVDVGVGVIGLLPLPQAMHRRPQAPASWPQALSKLKPRVRVGRRIGVEQQQRLLQAVAQLLVETLDLLRGGRPSVAPRTVLRRLGQLPYLACAANTSSSEITSGAALLIGSSLSLEAPETASSEKDAPNRLDRVSTRREFTLTVPRPRPRQRCGGTYMVCRP